MGGDGDDQIHAQGAKYIDTGDGNDKVYFYRYQEIPTEINTCSNLILGAGDDLVRLNGDKYGSEKLIAEGGSGFDQLNLGHQNDISFFRDFEKIWIINNVSEPPFR